MLKIVLISGSLKAGGLERVLSTLANSAYRSYHISIITLASIEPFYKLNREITLIQAPKDISSSNKLIRLISSFFWLRKIIKQIDPYAICSFGERYNSYVLISLVGLNKKIFVANRASPISSLKGFYFLANTILYKFASGIIFQTRKSFEILNPIYRLSNYLVIGNPICLDFPILKKENIILNVGSFSGNKNQLWLINYCENISKNLISEWQICFIGDGPLLDSVEKVACKSKFSKQFIFKGLIKNIKDEYSKAAVFAFTSTSEGFPNALAEAMAAGCACIAYDCMAGPSDIIDDGVNGFLIPLGEERLYIEKLQLLLSDEALRKKFACEAVAKMQKFEAQVISSQFFEFLTAHS